MPYHIIVYCTIRIYCCLRLKHRFNVFMVHYSCMSSQMLIYHVQLTCLEFWFRKKLHTCTCILACGQVAEVSMEFIYRFISNEENNVFNCMSTEMQVDLFILT